jgi:cell division septal protein FtsQ
LLLSAGLSRAYVALLDAPWLRVEEIELQGLKTLGKTEVLNTMGVSKGACVLDLSMSTIASRLRGLPKVKSAAVRYETSGRIVAEISEREPLAAVKLDGFFLVDEDGKLFAKAGPDEIAGFLAIGGLAGPDMNLREGGLLPPAVLGQVRELIGALDRSSSWLPRSFITDCRWSPSGFLLALGERALPVDLGRDGFDVKLARLRTAIDTLAEGQLTDAVTRIDLDYPNRAYIEGNFPPPRPVPGAGKPSS